MANPESIELGRRRRDQIVKFVEDYTHIHGRSPSTVKIAKHLGVTVPPVRKHLRALAREKRMRIEDDFQKLTVIAVHPHGLEGNMQCTCAGATYVPRAQRPQQREQVSSATYSDDD